MDMSDRIIYQSAGNERDYFLGLGHSYATMHSYTIDGFFSMIAIFILLPAEE